MCEFDRPASSGAAGQRPGHHQPVLRPRHRRRTASGPAPRPRPAAAAPRRRASRASGRRAGRTRSGRRSPRRRCRARCPPLASAIALEQVDVGEVQPLGLVDRHHPHGVLRRRERPPLLGLARLGDRSTAARAAPPAGRPRPRSPPAACGRSGRGSRRRYAPEARAASLASNSVSGAQPLDEHRGRLARERAAQLGQVSQERRRGCAPTPRRARDRGRPPGARRPPPPPARASRRGGRRPVSASSAHAVGERTRPQRDERGVGHADEARAQHRDQREVVAGVEHRADERRRLDDLAAAVVGAVALDDVGHAGVAQRLAGRRRAPSWCAAARRTPARRRPLARAPRGCRPRARAPRSPRRPARWSLRIRPHHRPAASTRPSARPGRGAPRGAGRLRGALRAREQRLERRLHAGPAAPSRARPPARPRRGSAGSERKLTERRMTSPPLAARRSRKPSYAARSALRQP